MRYAPIILITLVALPGCAGRPGLLRRPGAIAARMRTHTPTPHVAYVGRDDYMRGLGARK